MSKFLSFLSRFSVATVLLVVSMPAYSAGIFLKGSTNISLIIGSGSAFNENYTVIGAGFNYFIADGLSLGLEAETWTGGTRSINKYSPRVQYVFDVAKIKPYLGAFFTRASIEGFPEDQDSVGYRVGLYFDTRSNIYLSAGVVFENYQDCDEATFVSCSDTYPEVVLSFAL
jgi:hypothetical protein